MLHWSKYSKACLVFCKDHPSPVVFEDESWGHIEHTIHEVSHAVHLGWTVDKILDLMKEHLLSTAIGQMIPNANIFKDDREEQEEFALAEELETFCIEAACTKMLGLPLDDTDLIDAAVVQGVSGSEMRDALRAGGCESLGEKVVLVLEKYKDFIDAQEEELSPA